MGSASRSTSDGECCRSDRAASRYLYLAALHVLLLLNFAAAARHAGVRRIIYLGGLGDDADPKLSPHLRGRHEVGKTLRDSGAETIEFRASIVTGADSLSFHLMKSLTEPLPVMLCPRWLAMPNQPIALNDVLTYLPAAKDMAHGENRIFEIGGTGVSTYRELIREYARQRRLLSRAGERWVCKARTLMRG